MRNAVHKTGLMEMGDLLHLQELIDVALNDVVPMRELPQRVFHSHAHDDHFAGLTSLVRSARRIKYYAVPCVRATSQKKMAALMRFEEERFSRFFDVHDLVPGEWNDIEGMDVPFIGRDKGLGIFNPGQS